MDTTTTGTTGVIVLYPTTVSVEDIHILREYLGFRKQIFTHGGRDKAINEALERMLDAMEYAKEVT